MTKEKDPKEESKPVVPVKQEITKPIPFGPITGLTPEAQSLLHLTNDSTSHNIISLAGNIEAAPIALCKESATVWSQLGLDLSTVRCVCQLDQADMSSL